MEKRRRSRALRDICVIEEEQEDRKRKIKVGRKGKERGVVVREV